MLPEIVTITALKIAEGSDRLCKYLELPLINYLLHPI